MYNKHAAGAIPACLQDALLDEEGATPAGGFSGDANTVSLRLPQAQAETKQHMQTAEEAHEVSEEDPEWTHTGFSIAKTNMRRLLM